MPTGESSVTYRFYNADLLTVLHLYRDHLNMAVPTSAQRRLGVLHAAAIRHSQSRWYGRQPDYRSLFAGVLQPIRVYKKVRTAFRSRVIPLVLPPGAHIHISLTTDKCRASMVVSETKNAYSQFDFSYTYTPGLLEPDSPFSMLPKICAAGIHFFFRFAAARDYIYI
jgi:hypothetical protein